MSDKGAQDGACPAGCRTNAQGHYVPEGAIAEIDKLRDDLVRRLSAEARAVAEAVAAFRTRCRLEIAAFVELAGQEHGVAIGGEKGNVTLTSFDGRLRIQRAVDERIEFTEGLAVARALVAACVGRWSEGANRHLVALVNKAFAQDKAGNLSTARILSLLSLGVDDPEWSRAMEALRGAIRVSGTATYLRFYERDAAGKYVQIPLDADGKGGAA